MKFRAFLVGLLLMVPATSALAVGPYMGVSGGVSVIHDGDIDDDFDSVEAKYDTGFGFNINAGYNFEPYRLEFEFGYKNADMDEVSGYGETFSVSDTEITVMSFMANALYDFKTKSPFTPYLGAGIGLLNGELEIGDYEEDENTFGYQLIVGGAYNINKNLAFDLSYRFQHAPSDFSVEGVDVEYMSSSFMAGIRYNF